MHPNASIHLPQRGDPVARRVIAAWRRLTGGRSVRDDERPTLVACSGGADSSALALALASTPATIVIAHIVHDMRPAADADEDRAAVEQLAHQLRRPFVSGIARGGTDPGNAEANLRRARYAQLRRLAAEARCIAVATGHHADDQAETVLMRLLRGTGPTGLAAIRERRRLAPGLDLIRPMLQVRRADARDLCARCGWSPRHDATNDDTSRVRAALRAQILPALDAITPSASARIADAATWSADIRSLLRTAADDLLSRSTTTPTGRSWPRAALISAPALLLGELTLALAPQPRGLRYRDAQALRRAIQTTSTRPMTLRVAGVHWRVGPDEICIDVGGARSSTS